MKGKEQTRYLLSLLVSVSIALAIGALMMWVTGHNPFEGYAALFEGTGLTGNRKALGNTLYKSAQLAIAGLATAVASSGGIFNVGGERQMYLGALASCYLGARLTGLSPWIALPICLLAAILAGALYAWIPAIMKVKLKINEVITTIFMNTVAIKFCEFMAKGPLKTTEKRVPSGTAKIDPNFLFSVIPLSSDSRDMSNLNTSIFWTAAVVLLVWYLMSRTTTGYEMRLTGQNSRFAKFIGIRSGMLGILGMLISGAMCGALGMFESFGVQVRFVSGFSKEFYFDGMLVAMIMRYRPLGIILMSFFFGALKTGAEQMKSTTSIQPELVIIIQAVIIFLMAARDGMMANLRMRRAGKHPSIAKEA